MSRACPKKPQAATPTPSTSKQATVMPDSQLPVYSDDGIVAYLQGLDEEHFEKVKEKWAKAQALNKDFGQA